MFKMIFSVIVMLGLIVLAIDDMAAFIDGPSFIIVFAIALLFGIAGSTSLKNRVQNFSKGAVLAGWIGVLIGAIQILGNINFSETDWMEWIAPANAVMLITVIYGYTVKGVCFLIAENLPSDNE